MGVRDTFNLGGETNVLLYQLRKIFLIHLELILFCVASKFILLYSKLVFHVFIAFKAGTTLTPHSANDLA